MYMKIIKYNDHIQNPHFLFGHDESHIFNSGFKKCNRIQNSLNCDDYTMTDGNHT